MCECITSAGGDVYWVGQFQNHFHLLSLQLLNLTYKKEGWILVGKKMEEKNSNPIIYKLYLEEWRLF